MAEKILIVDDDLETLRLVGLMLQRQGYQIVAASNGAQALATAKSELPDLILLDVMMPDMDGYEVTRQLRADPTTTNASILMFTAKSQVDDKVTGYESGVDDYLTKPTHPAELTAHVKVLLSRSGKMRASAQSAVGRGHVAAVVSAKGGTGSSTLALNSAVALHNKTNATTIVAELRPGMGSWGMELGYNKTEGLSHLLRMKSSEISTEAVEKELLTNNSGVRLLMATNHMKDVELLQAVPQMEAIVSQLPLLANLTILDIGNNLFPGLDRILSLCNEIILVVEPHPITVARSKVLLEDLNERGFGKSKTLTTVLINRVRADIQLTWTQVQEALQQPINQVISPAPELAYQAALRFTPMIMVQPEGLIAQQYTKLAEFLSQRVQKT